VIPVRYAKAEKLARRAFRDLSPDEATKAIIVLVAACESARTTVIDADAVMREKDRDAIDGLDGVKRAARGVAGYLRRHPTQVHLVMLEALVESGVRLQDAAGEVTDQTLLLTRLLGAVDAALIPDLLVTRRGPLLHRVVVGPLVYADAIDHTARLPDQPTQLALFLAFLMRTHSLIGSFRHQVGELMPKGGKPRWSVVEALVDGAFQGHGEAACIAAKKFAERNRDVGFRSYPL
jgi:hypothetical protein